MVHAYLKGLHCPEVCDPSMRLPLSSFGGAYRRASSTFIPEPAIMLSTTIKLAIASCAAVFGVVQAQIQGFDISHYQATVDFAAAYSSGARFVIIKVIYKRRAGKPLIKPQQLTMHTRQPKERRMLTPPFRTTTPPLQMPVSYGVPITLLTRSRARVPCRPRYSLPAAVGGRGMA
jgi:hypothetical protein